MEGVIFYFGWERAFMEGFQQTMAAIGSWTVSAASALTFLGEEMILVAILAFFYFSWDKEAGKKVGCTICVGLVLNPMIKNIFNRRRPYFDDPNIKCLKTVDPDYDIYDVAGQGYSFPSGHSMNSVIAYGSLPAYLKKNILTILLSVILPLLVGFSRVMVGVHYPTDVITGWILGFIVLIAMNRLHEKVPRKILLPIIFVISCAGLFYCRTADYFTAIGLMGGVFVSIFFEEKFVNFKNTRKPLYMILRLIGGFALYFTLNTLLKLPFSSEFLKSGLMSALIIRTVRYFVVSFVVLGVYPMIFKIVEKS